jgi:hypothetical protein
VSPAQFSNLIGPDGMLGIAEALKKMTNMEALGMVSLPNVCAHRMNKGRKLLSIKMYRAEI